MKECTKCHEVKPLDQFYKHSQMSDKVISKCKECTKKDVQANYRKNIDYYKDYEKQRCHLPHRVKARKDYAATKPEALRRGQKAYIERYPQKRIAHIMVGNALRDGRLIKKPCEVCGEIKVEAHHEDYYKPLEVNWLCTKHHVEYHFPPLSSAHTIRAARMIAAFLRARQSASFLSFSRSFSSVPGGEANVVYSAYQCEYIHAAWCASARLGRRGS